MTVFYAYCAYFCKFAFIFDWMLAVFYGVITWMIQVVLPVVEDYKNDEIITKKKSLNYPMNSLQEEWNKKKEIKVKSN